MDFADACYVCGIGDNEDQLLVCDKCDYKICHISCCGLAQIPEGEWTCQFCLEIEQNEQRRRKKCKRRRFRKRNGDKKNKKRRRRRNRNKSKKQKKVAGENEEEKSEVEFMFEDEDYVPESDLEDEYGNEEEKSEDELEICDTEDSSIKERRKR